MRDEGSSKRIWVGILGGGSYSTGGVGSGSDFTKFENLVPKLVAGAISIGSTPVRSTFSPEGLGYLLIDGAY